MHTIKSVGIRSRWSRYGRDAVEALRADIAAAKGTEPLTPVTVIVASNQVGVSARRLLASGAAGPVCGSGTGLVAVSFLTAYRLAELLGAPALAGAGRRPISTPVLTAAVRASLKEAPGIFEPVAAHFATEAALVAGYQELRDPSSAALDALAGRGERAADVIRLHRATRARLEPGWYDEEDLMTAAVDSLSVRDDNDVRAAIGAVVVYLPQRLSRHAATLLTGLAAKTDTSVVAALTGDARADAEVTTSVERLGLPLDAGLLPQAGPVTSVERTHFFTASDADEEVREAVRAVIDAARAGTPLDRVAILSASPEPYDRLIREQLIAAEIPVNGATEVPVAVRLAGRTLLQLLELPALGFRRQDVFAWLAGAPVRHGDRLAPVSGWERLSRDAGVVGGRRQWDELLLVLSDQLKAKAELAENDPERPHWRSEKLHGDANRASHLRSFVLDLIDRLETAAASPQPWSTRAAWAHDLLDHVLGGGMRRERWPAVERKAAERVELALQRLAALDAVEDAVDLDVFSRTLAIELEADLGRVGRFGEGVFVGSIGMGVGLDLDLLILLGLAEGSFPAPIHDDSLLPDSEREAADGELALRSQRIDREHRQFLAALAGADKHILGIPRGDLRRSRERVPSRWAIDVASSLADERWWSTDLIKAAVPWVHHVKSFDHGIRHLTFPATDQEHRLLALLAAGVPRDELAALTETTDPATSSGVRVLDARRSPAFTRFDGNLAGLAIPSPVERGTSATNLERWAKCPHAYLVQTLLGAEELENPEEQLELSALDRGNLIHEVLETFLDTILARPPAERPAPHRAWSPAERAVLGTIAAERCAQYEARGLTGRPIFWRRDRRRILTDLDLFLDADDSYRAASGARPVATELAFGFRDGMQAVNLALPDGRMLPLRGKVDRVDVADDGTLHVLDYKSGKPGGYRKLSEDNPHERGTKLQLAIYGQAARQYRQQPEAVVKANYWFVSTGGQFKQIGYSVTPEVLARVSTTLGVIVEGIERGVFTSHPAAPSTSGRVSCAFCDPDGLGTAELRRQWDRKIADEILASYVDLVDGIDADSDIDRNGVDGVTAEDDEVGR